MRVATMAGVGDGDGDVATSVSLIMLIIDYGQLKWSLRQFRAIRLKDLCYKVVLEVQYLALGLPSS